VPYRSRPINWNYLLQPSMRGIDYKARAGENLAQMILGAGQNIGAGLSRRQDRAERRREFDAQYGLAERRQGLAEGRFALDLREENRKREDQRIADEFVRDLLAGDYDQANKEIAAFDAMGPKTAENLNRDVKLVGGPERALPIIQAYEEVKSRCGPSG